MRKRILFAFLALLCLWQSQAQSLTVRQIMQEPSIAGMRPEAEKISPDGRIVAFLWNAEAKRPRNLYIASTRDAKARLLVNASTIYEQRQQQESKLNYGLVVRDDFLIQREKELSNIEFSPDSKRILFIQSGDIYLVEIETGYLRRITRTQGVESQARWLTNSKILFSSAGNFYVFDLESPFITQITKEGNPSSFQTITLNLTSKDGLLFAYVLSDGSRQRSLIVPDYLDEFVQARTVRRGWTEQKVLVTRTDGSLERPFEIRLPKPEGNYYIRGLRWTSDNNLLIDRVDADTKRRIIFLVRNIGKQDEKIITITEERDEKWIAPLSRLIEANPQNPSQIVFASEKSGFNHLYLAEVRSDDSVETRQLTQGDWEIDWFKWLDSKRIIYTSTEANTAEREFYILDVTSGKRELFRTEGSGMKTNPQLSENSSMLIYSFSRWNLPTDVYAVEVCKGCVSVKITNSVPSDFLRMKWNEPQFVDIRTRDGKVVKSKIYLPEDFSKSRKYPMVIFVHGAGYLQNTINGWNNYYREFMFNQLLTQKGYVVLDIDYRGSAGYGRDWRTDVYDFLGGKDYEDHLDAIDYMIENYSIDPNRIGVYGGSYGGFMAAMLVMRAPEKIACAAALRPVFDWKNYYASSPIYTTERLGYPDKNPEAYRRSSPIAYAEKLQKPLLILHGLVDDNVHAQDSIQLIEKLIRLEKTQFFEAMFYPSENHGFQRPTSWADEYERILMFFEKYLK
ncbi:MAG: alpha/beta fold hydrolase [Pyrinomonadaceae bacterium]|nr:alpha/beta fold hydrolase [Pyrinomonadaceae bacterium]MCX7640832.1 alpha/beta fold hydrolase [Pyrinomonadaceae bacterium]MDW8303403.1 alpha/beta fold hydrolase [Acidobacteriota bacterium]